MDSKAQASSVFQLLISAVVALAILMILLQVLGLINIFNVNQDPADAAANQLKDAWTKNATIKTTPSNVTFTSSAKNINSISLASASKIGITPEQICLSLGDFQESSSPLFEINSANNSIDYKGSSTKDAKISVYCYTGTKLQSTLEELESDVKADWASNCSCLESEETCCLVALRFEKR